MLQHLLPTPPQSAYFRGALARNPTVTLEFLGTAGFVVHGPNRTVVLDPYVSRPSLRATLLRHLHPNKARIRQYIPQADDVLVGHAHFDHVLDAPDLCLQTGARLIGSADVCNVGRAVGVPEDQMLETHGGEYIPCGSDGTFVRGIRSIHGKVQFGRIPIPGNIVRPPRWPPRARDLKCGDVLDWHVHVDGVDIVHIDSADFFDDELRGVPCDVLCLCAAGRKYREGYVRDAIQLLKPRAVVPCHWDAFFTAPEYDLPLIPGIRLPEMVAEIEACGPTSVLLPFGGRVGLGTDWTVGDNA